MMDADDRASVTPDQPARSSIREQPWTSGPIELPRGRSAKDPQARTTTYHCQSVDELERSLRAYLENPSDNPEHCTCAFTIWPGAAFPTNPVQLPSTITTRPGHGEGSGSAPSQDEISQGARARETLTVMDALMPTSEPKESMKKQRIIAKAIVEAIQRSDGYRYSFHNNWRSGEDAAYRFSYYCNDSLLNKDRVANGKAGTHGKRATKAVYDCRGIISVKFSAKQQSLEVIYKHIPIHKTYEERAPVPRRDSKRRKLMELHNPEALPARCRPKFLVAEQESEENKDVKAPKNPRKKRTADSEPAVSNTSIESELRVQSMQSLLELMLPDKAAPSRDISISAPQQTKHEAGIDRITSALVHEPETPKRSRKSRVCAICKHKRMRCDGVKPRCNTCSEKNWPCFFIDDPSPTADVMEDSEDDDNNVSIQYAYKTADELGTELLEAKAVVERSTTDLKNLQNRLNEARRRVKRLEAAKAKAVQLQQAERERQTERERQAERERQSVRERKVALERQAELDLHAGLLERQARRAVAQNRQQTQTSHRPASRPQQTQYEFPSVTAATQTFGLPFASNNDQKPQQQRQQQQQQPPQSQTQQQQQQQQQQQPPPPQQQQQQQYQPSFVATYPHQAFHTPNGYVAAPATPQQQQQPQQQSHQRTTPTNTTSNFRVKTAPDMVRWAPIYGYPSTGGQHQQQGPSVNASPPLTGQQSGLQESYRWLTTNGSR